MSTEEQEREQAEKVEQAERMKTVALGIEAEHFVASPVGRMMIERAEVEREKALTALVAADPAQVEEVRRLQNEVRVIDMVQQWLADAIMEGHAMAKALVDEEIEGGGA